MTSIKILARSVCAACALTALSHTAYAETTFAEPAEFTARVRISGENRTPIYAGGTAHVQGSRFTAGQTVTFERGGVVLTDALTVNAEGEVTAQFDIPADAALGLHPIVVKTSGPDSASVVDLKVSPKIEAFGEDKFNVTKAQLGGGLYQVAVSEANNTLFVTHAVRRENSFLSKIDATTLEVLAKVDAHTPEGSETQFAVHGVGVDDKHGNVWVTNTRQNSVAVYSQDELSLVKQFAEDTASHPRDVIFDEANDRIYVSVSAAGINVYDAEKLEFIETIEVPTDVRGEEFRTMSADLDEVNGQLYTVSLNTPELAKIDLASGDVKLFPLEGAVRASGVDVSEDGTKVFVASQHSDDLMILNAEDGKVISDVRVGAQPLNVVYADDADLAFVANRASDSVAVVTGAGELVANLAVGTYPNFIEETKAGVIYMVNKARDGGADADSIWRIEPK